MVEEILPLAIQNKLINSKIVLETIKEVEGV